MRFSKTTKRVLSLAMTAAVAASSVAAAPAPKKADAAGSYKAYLCFASKTYKGETVRKLKWCEIFSH